MGVSYEEGKSEIHPLEHGGISIGIIPPLKECIAVAHEGRNTLAMLKRRKGESLAQLLSRLDRLCDLFDDRGKLLVAESETLPQAEVRKPS